jgi:hypothetical protein
LAIIQVASKRMEKMAGNEPGKVRKFLTRSLAVVALLGVYVLATAGVMGVVTATTDNAAQARGFGRGGGGFRGGGRGGWGRGGWGRGGGRGRFWHGRYWGYGSGPCWRATPAGWIWICG